MLFAVLDFETTGLPFHPKAPLRKQPKAIEFAALLTDGKEVLDTLEFICNPGVDVEPIITKITGLTNAALRTHKPFHTFIPQIADFLGRADAVIAHNLPFDRFIMESDLRRNEKVLADVNWPRIQICTIEQTVHEYGYQRRLQHLYEENIGPYVQKHRALDDVRLLHEVCKIKGVYSAYTSMEGKQ